MGKTYVLIDTMNMMFRARHMTRGDVDTQIGMSMHILFNSLRKVWRDFKADHVVCCLEGSSWRKKEYSKYKLNRKIAQSKKTSEELYDDKLFIEAMNNFTEFLKNDTNVTVLQHKDLEADDLIAFWVDSHPDDNIIIISSDSDFIQLLKHDNVSIFNGMTNVLMKQDGIFNDKGKRLKFHVKNDSKIKVGKPEEFYPEENWYEYAMFLKIVRGDTSDNIFSAYPGARVKGSSKTIGIREAFEDRHNKGYTWNNFMLQKWVDMEENEHRVKDKFEENQKLIDLSMQPEEIKLAGYESIMEAQVAKKIPQVGTKFLKFCGQWDLKNISRYPDEYAKMLNSTYK